MKEKNVEKYKIHLLIFVAAVAPPVNRAEHRAEMSGLRKRCYGSLVTDHQATRPSSAATSLYPSHVDPGVDIITANCTSLSLPGLGQIITFNVTLVT